VNHHPSLLLHDLRDRLFEQDALLSQLLGDPERHQLRPSDEAVLLGAHPAC